MVHDPGHNTVAVFFEKVAVPQLPNKQKVAAILSKVAVYFV